MLVARYKYDSLSRLIREDNKPLNKTVTWEYDAGGNIQNRFEYEYTIAQDLSNLSPTIIPYSYANSGIRDKLIEYNSEQFEYDAIGNPTIYRNCVLTWEKGRQLKSYGNVASYTYNASGIRTSKTVDTTTTQYFLDGTKILAQKDIVSASENATTETLMKFIYGIDGIIGFTLTNTDGTDTNYYYKKNLQGDIVAIYDNDLNEIVKYNYDAWGNHNIKFVNSNGDLVDFDANITYNTDIETNLYVALKNPFRYRGYYYDFETGLYYLNSRYYDPEIGRFINIDDIGVINDYKDVFNGLNLFAYCINNPIMHVDENGRGFLDWLLGIISVVVVAAATVLLVAASVATGGLLGVAIGAVATTMAINAAIGGVTALANGTSFAAGVFGGAVSGAAIGFSIGLGIMTGGGAIGFIPAILGVLSSNYLAGNLSYVINKGLNGEQITWKGAMTSGGLHIASGLFAFATGFLMGGVGAYNLPKALTNMLKSNLPIKAKLLSEAARNFYGSIILKSSLFWPINAYLNGIRKQQ